jgi:bis(5'-nucleosidyl)-tetraphosphatase
MPIEKSAGAVIFRREPFDATQGKEKILYLLLNYPSTVRRTEPYWDFPKGHVEGSESMEETAKREIGEETGLKEINIIEGFKKTIKYFFKAEGKNIMKFVTFFLAETREKDIKISEEHVGFLWLSFSDATKTLAFQNAKDILKAADDFLFRKGG